MPDPEMSVLAGQTLAYLKIIAFALPIIGAIMIVVKIVERHGEKKYGKAKPGRPEKL